MIKIHDSLYVNEDAIALVTIDAESGNALIFFTNPIQFPVEDDSDVNYQTDFIEGETVESKDDSVGVISIDADHSEILFEALDMLSINVEDEYEDEYEEGEGEVILETEGVEEEAEEGEDLSPPVLDWPDIDDES